AASPITALEEATVQPIKPKKPPVAIPVAKAKQVKRLAATKDPIQKAPIDKRKITIISIIAGIVVAAVLIAVLIISLVRRLLNNRDHIRGKPVLFPNVDCGKRLGGEHSGGAFAAISFEMGNSSGVIDY
ncbi:MAG: hypothetical protein AAF226_18870, partial [Verrucomicrobiota bacterium]